MRDDLLKIWQVCCPQRGPLGGRTIWCE